MFGFFLFIYKEKYFAASVGSQVGRNEGSMEGPRTYS